MPPTGDSPEPEEADTTGTTEPDEVEPPNGAESATGAAASAEADTDVGNGDGDGAETTLAQRRQRAAEAATRQRTDWLRIAKRYGPFVAVAVLVAGAIAIFGSGGGDGDGTTAGDESFDDYSVPSEEELISSGPMTPQRAELEGSTDVDFGPHCDTEIGRLMLPIVYAPPCVEPFEGGNGGATSTGVTEDEVLIVRYSANPEIGDPQSVSTLLNLGIEDDPAAMDEALEDYTRLYNEVFETYGRTVRVEEYVGTGAGNDRDAARADAIAIAEMEPFAVVGGPWEAGNVFAEELAAQGVVCGPACALAQPDSMVQEYFPYIWLPGPTIEQSALLLAEMVSKLAGPGPAEMAGDPELQETERSYALLHYDTPDGDFEEQYEATTEALEEAGIDLTLDVELELNLSEAEENARTVISRLQGQGITTIIYTGEPLTPMSLTGEATDQGYQPEWIVGPGVFTDYTVLARALDGEQWSHGFGMSWGGARVTPGTGDAATIYRWAFGVDNPSSASLLSEATIRWAFQGIHLAGPNLTPETFRDAMFRNPGAGGGPTAPYTSLGDQGMWPGTDLGSVDDLTLIWWDPDVSGVDEIDQQGQGMYRYANGGARYRLGEIPESPEEAGLFDDPSSVMLYEDRPAEDQAPREYPPPDLGD